MECLYLKENFIFCSNISVSFNNSDSFDEITLLLTIDALYFFEKKNYQIKEGPDILESHLLCKFKHEEIYLKSISSNDDSIGYNILKKNRYNIHEFLLKFSNQPKGKEYVKILILFEGWKYAVKSIKSSCSNKKIQIQKISLNEDSDKNSDDNENSESYEINDYEQKEQIDYNVTKYYLFKIIEKFIIYDYVLIIDYIFLILEKYYKGFVKLFFICISYFKKIQFKIILDDDISKTVYNFFPKQSINLCLRHLNLSSINLKDKYVTLILIPFINNSPHLENLNISNNLLTNYCLNILIQELKPNIFLKTFNISYNKITSNNLSKIIYELSKIFLSITLFDLRGNKIDNNFLNNFEPKNYEELHLKIQDLINSPNSTKETIIFDLRGNEIDLEKTSLRFYLKKKKELSSHLEIKNIFNENFEIKYSGFDFMKFIFDVYFFHKNYKFNNASKNQFKLNVDVKYFQLRIKELNKLIIRNEINRNDKYVININNDDKNKIQNQISASDDSNNEDIISTSKKPKKKINKTKYTKEKKIEIIKEEEIISNNKNNDLKLKNINKNKEDSIIVEDDNEEEIEIKKKEEKQNVENLQIKNSKSKIKEYELDLYRKLFKYFFLLDYYFDPILNSFSTYNSKNIKRGNDYMNIKNQDERYSQLRMSINSKEKFTYIPYKRINKKENLIEISDEEFKQMYYEYNNNLNYIQTHTINDKPIKKKTINITTQDILEEINENLINPVNYFPKNIRFNPNGYIDHFSYLFIFLLKPHDYKIKIPFTTLNKFISRIKIESILSYKEKSHYSLSALSKITKALNLSLQEQINKKYDILCQKSQVIIKGLQEVLNFEGKDKYYLIKNLIFESGKYLDIFIKKADEINLDCDLVNIGKYIQFWRDNYLRNEIKNFILKISKNEDSSRNEEEKKEKNYKNKGIKKKQKLDIKTMKNISRINNFDSFNSEIDNLNLDIKTINEININKDLKNFFDIDDENKEEKKDEEEIKEEIKLKENEGKKEQSIILNDEEIEIKKKDDNIDEKLKKIDVSAIKTLKEFSYENTENKIESSKNNDINDEEDI